MSAVRWAISATLLAAVVAFVLATFGAGNLLRTARELSSATLLLVFAALLVNAVAASMRLKVIAADIGHPIRLRHAVAAVSAGSIAGVVFFQIAGQLMGRGAILGRHGVAFSTVVVMTAYERAVAAILSALLATAGAYHIFGQVMIDGRSGGTELMKIAAGLIAATTAGALVAYGRPAARAIAPFMTQRFVVRFLRSVALSLAVQTPMMIAYVAAARALSPVTPLADLCAASAIVMFAAGVPISLAGWGIREMSAVVALGAIGLRADQALVAATVVGLGSLAAMAVAAIASSGSWLNSRERAQVSTPRVDYSKTLGWGVPIAVATLVLFQLHVPIRSGSVNVNLADPVVILGGALFALSALRRRQAPQWRIPNLNAAIAAATLMFTLSLLIGVAEFGWTTWALTNKFLGWFVLLGFGLTGALIVRESSEEGLRILLLTYAGATSAIVAIEALLATVRAAGYPLSEAMLGYAISGFAQNRNAFAFQLLMALIATIAVARGRMPRVMLMAMALAGIWLCGSRAAWIALPLVLAVGVYMRATTLREIGISACCAALVLFITVAPVLPTLLQGGEGARPATAFLVFALPDETSTAQRIHGFIGAWRLFLDHPLLGAGLGAFMQQEIATTGHPLVIHSTMAWLLAEMGIVGFLVFLLPAFYILFVEARRRDLDAAGRAIVLCIVAFGVMSAAHEMLYQRTLWLILGAAMAHIPNVRPAPAKLLRHLD